MTWGVGVIGGWLTAALEVPDGDEASPPVPVLAHATAVAPTAARPAARSQARGKRTGRTSQQVGRRGPPDG